MKKTITIERAKEMYAWPYNLLALVNDGRSVTYPDDIEATVEYCVAAASPTTRLIINKIFREGLTQFELRQEMGLERSDMHRKILNVINEFKRPPFCNYLHYGVAGLINWLRRGLKVSAKMSIPITMIEGITPSCRTNLIEANHLKTVGDIVRILANSASPKEARRKLYGVGEKYFNELIEALNQMGITDAVIAKYAERNWKVI